MAVAEEVLGTFHGSDEFPIEWQEGEKELFWIYDDLHIPNPVSPMFFDIGGWWLTCDHMFRRFGTPFASRLDRQERSTATSTRPPIPADPAIRSEATEYQARYVPRVPRDPEYAGKIGAYLGWRAPRLRRATSSTGGATACARRSSATSSTSTASTTTPRRCVELAVLLEDAIDVHDRHWKIHWMLNFAQFSSTTNLNAVDRGGARRGRPGADGPPAVESSRTATGTRSRTSGRSRRRSRATTSCAAAFEGETARRRACARSTAPSAAGASSTSGIVAHQKTFGYKSIWSHEFAFKTWREDPAPIVEAIRGYLATDYDYPSNIQSVRDDLEAAKVEVMEGVDGDGARDAAGGARPVARR